MIKDKDVKLIFSSAIPEHWPKFLIDNDKSIIRNFKSFMLQMELVGAVSIHKSDKTREILDALQCYSAYLV